MDHAKYSYSLSVDTAKQRLCVYHQGLVIDEFPISTALNGVGEQQGSNCTPRGLHMIRAVIGRGMPENSVFVARRATGEIYNEELAQLYPNRDWILTRILWLSGLEVGKNRLGKVDTFRRFIYIHGTPSSEPIGVANSHGCIRMHNKELLLLMKYIIVGMEVNVI